jgi:F-type H+-transporting ATPase subunit b
MTPEQAEFYESIARWSQIVCAILFLAFLVWAWFKWIAPAVEAAAKARNAEIAGTEKHRDELKAAVARARGELENADKDAAAIRARAGDDAARERTRILDEAHADAARIISNAEGELARARLAAQAELRSEFIDRALDLARTQAASRIDDAKNLALVHATVDGITAGKGA